MKDAVGHRGGGRGSRRKRGRKGGGIDGLWGRRDRRPTERKDKALTLLPGCILAGRQLWIGNITAAGN